LPGLSSFRLLTESDRAVCAAKVVNIYGLLDCWTAGFSDVLGLLI